MNNSKSIIGISIFGVLTAILWNVPGGNYILYPFTILGTWFHEFSHGITAEILGGNFNKLVVFPNGSGYAEFSYSSLFLGPIGKAMVAAAGPMGPSVIGGLLLLSSRNIKYSRIALYLLSFILIVSTILWVRPIISFGFLISIIFSVLFTFIALKGNDKLKVLTVQFIGVQAFMSLYLSIGYLFSTGAVVGGSPNLSDTQVIADNLLLPHWVWAILIILSSLLILIKSIDLIIKGDKKENLQKF